MPIETRFPDESILCVPAPAPVFKPVVPFKVVPVMVSALSIVPKPDVIDPAFNAPTVVKDDVTTKVPRVFRLIQSFLLSGKNSLLKD